MAVAARTGGSSSWQPFLGAEPARLRELGALLRLRRAALGYRHVPAFVAARDINTRMVTDAERGRRDTYTFPTLEDIAAAYGVTYDSMRAVVWSGAGELVPAPPAAPVQAAPAFPADPGEPPGWMAADKARTAANRPFADRIRGRLDVLRLQGAADPAGAELFGAGTADAEDWDKYAADWDVRDVVWFVADLQRRAAGRRTPPPQAGAQGA